MSDTVDNIIKFEKKSWAMKPYAAFRWGKNMPCPIRLVVNTYKGCDYKHKYCYVWSKNNAANQKTGFRKSLKSDIKLAKERGLNNYVVMVSSSTDPFQPIEKKCGETLFAVRELLKENFSILIMTRNPARLLEKDYYEVVGNKNVFIDVSVPSLSENNPESIFFGSGAPKLGDTLSAIKKLVDVGKCVRIKIEPVIPTFGGIRGQTDQELRELVAALSEAGIKKIIAKTMRLNKDVPPIVYNNFIDYYKENGREEGINWVLNEPTRKKLIRPVFEACLSHGISFCCCVEVGIFPEATGCLLPGEKSPAIMSVLKEAPINWIVEEVNNKNS